MNIINLCKKINEIVHCNETHTLGEALGFLENSGYRCIPILDEKEERFLGNIYTSNIYECLYKQTGKATDSVMSLVKNQDTFVYEHSSFFNVFTNIRSLPFLPILNEEDHFVGLLTHSQVIDILEDIWGINDSSYALSIICPEYKGALKKITNIVNKHTSIQSLATFDNKQIMSRRILLTLPKETSEEMKNSIVESLNTAGFRIFDIEQK
ncbi:cyclic di-AMP binding protein CbpA [Bacillaceae bacterium IKA-2]|nr:cyclic di-AMP binding protein CbpA [Bacillaceae bacterium IKA-2]